MKKILAGVFTVLISSLGFFIQAQPDGLLHVYFLNVGQGDSILIKTPSGKYILVDGGPGNGVLSELSAVLPFFNKEIEYALLTHPDRDHSEGIISVIKNYRVHHLMSTGVYSDSAPFGKRALATAKEKTTPVIVTDKESDVFFEDGVTIDVLFPLHQMIGQQQDTNNTSIIAKLRYGENEVLLTGDAEMEEEKELLDNKIDLRADVLKVAHHGSKTSSIENFVKAVSPRYAVISVGKNNSYHHPHPSVVQRLQKDGIKIFRTDQNGRIEFVFSKEKLIEIKTQR